MIKNYEKEAKDTDHVFQGSVITRFGERLSTLIQGESYKSFAKKCGMSDKAIRDYVSGKTFPALDRIAHIADVTGCSFEWLTTGRTVNKYATYDEVKLLGSNECHEPSTEYRSTKQTNKSATSMV
ncbi:helix-turn-helix transcriptional regulator [Xenorhabdus sp. SGI240]|uniref:helix-turn-helix domain-containing protein n=1 Tax=Xenorhabdus sp. SGI240 TaxID=3158262 RepID=UPI0032B7A9D3